MVSNLLTDLSILKKNQESHINETSELISSLKNSIIEIKNSITLSNTDMELNNDDSSNNKVHKIINLIGKIEENNTLKKYNVSANSYYNNLTKYSKSLSQLEKEELYNNTYNNQKISFNKDAFLTILIKDLYRKGNFNTANTLINESKINFNSNFKYLFNDLNIITQELKNGFLEGLLNWIKKYETHLKDFDSDLPFELNCFRFILLKDYKDLNKNEILNRGKFLFKDYISDFKYLTKISKAYSYMTLYDSKSINSDLFQNKYANFMNKEAMISKLIEMFTRDCCLILNIPLESGFFLTLLAGLISMPQIVKSEAILKDKKDISNNKELPYEISLPNELKFHSIFICPVAKEISTIDNPPMLLTCGHVISKNSLNKMNKTVNSNSQIKCPTCPNSQSITDCIELKIF
jgi:hypothetical protein